MSSSSEWPEFESTTLTKAPEWTLRTESELHVERLEAKLDNIRKKNSRTIRQKQIHDSIQPQEQMDLDAEEIQQDEQEADEGLWLLWNNTGPSTPIPDESSKLLNNNTNPPSSYGITSTSTPFQPQPEDIENQDENQNEEREERLETAKANAKHVQEYLKEDTCYSRSCCCTIM